MTIRTLALTLSLSGMVAACGNSEPAPKAQETPVSVPSVSDFMNTKVSTWVAGFMRSEDGDTWYVKAPTAMDVSMSDASLNGTMQKEFEAEVRAAHGDALGEYPSSPSCFIGTDKDSAAKKIDAYIGPARSDGKRIVEVN